MASKIYFSFRGDFGFPWKSSSWREFPRVFEKKRPLSCFSPLILINIIILLFPATNKEIRLFSAYYGLFICFIQAKTPFFLPPHLGKIRRVPEQGSRSRKERKSGGEGNLFVIPVAVTTSKAGGSPLPSCCLAALFLEASRLLAVFSLKVRIWLYFVPGEPAFIRPLSPKNWLSGLENVGFRCSPYLKIPLLGSFVKSFSPLKWR